MREDIKEILFSEDTIISKVKEIAANLSEDYKGKELLVVGVLKGSVIFTSELLKYISIPCELDFIAVSSYGNSSQTSGVVRILKDLDNDVAGKDVIIVEDIVDTGLTLSYLLKYFEDRNANSIEIVSLLNKPVRRKTNINVKYYGFEVPDEFIVGYGIDYAEKYRNLPFIASLKEEVYNK
ncbi:hypoxanthine phosphoribosyltransferase [Clostridium folliculivorans]|uniref:Hypoxanthine phosphoribosyltransferase n=1 Tax=Clostridium folliculivorans TaxID=2886038 RepID=A0A9W5Y438_9CLOT|nr:hypoxanthine phosphoribosyltransferase [Clostridium folliculivorans]GKU26153.1 hypoxanthine phosphoribosyltransferase [Clostridium folliculivorans]GKU28239.1 hypoxanthine phosphoribosyltransferase [Clostridium folliculivorans]